MATLTMDTNVPVGYADLRTLIDIDPPQYEFEVDGELVDFRHSQYIYEEEERDEKERARAAQKDKRPGAKLHQKDKSKDTSEVGVQDGGGDSEVAQVEVAPPTKKGKQLEPVFEEIEFDDEFDLRDDESWLSVPPTHMRSRFNQFRKLTSMRLDEYENQMETTITKTQRKVETLKAQFHEHKKKWEQEREVIIDQVEQAAQLHRDAEDEADRAITQLEDFITEQEVLEREEETVRRSLDNGTREPSMSLAEAEKNLSQLNDQQVEADRLLAQTDDAKAEQSRLEAQSGDKSVFKIEGDSPEEISRSSAISRQSLRQEHREALHSLKASATDRRSKSPGIASLRSQKSILSDLELDEDGDMPFPSDETKEERESRETKASMHDMATSPMTKSRSPSTIAPTPAILSREPTVPEIQEEEEEEEVEEDEERKQIPMSEHPVVQEYLKSYDGVVTFKDNLSKLFTDREILLAGQLLAEIEALNFDRDDKVQPQVELMTNNVVTMLEEIYQVIASIINTERDYPVSSLYNLSRDPTRSVLTHHTTESRANKSRLSEKSTGSETGENLKQLQSQYIHLQQRFDVEAKKHTEQLNHNTVVMMEMQDTINALQRELAALGEKHPLIPESAKDTPIMFTRLDSERNSKVMKRAVNEERLDTSKYQQAVETMDAYVEIPSKRLAHLARKYSHHVQMREIEDSVRQSNSLDDKVFEILDRMEALQNERARRWAEKMDEYTSERMRLANLLMVTLDEIERESGIFLIKPMFSYRSVLSTDLYKGKLSRAYKPPREQSPFGRLVSSSLAPVPTPASARHAAHHVASQQQHQQQPPQQPQPVSRAQIRTSRSEAKSGSALMGQQSLLLGDYPRPVWNPSESNGKQINDEQLLFLHQSNLNTPRMLELDINRMLIGQNQISMKIPPNMPATNDRLINAANTTTRAYVTINRPSGTSGSGASDRTGEDGKDDRPRSHTGIPEQAVPPTTPMVRTTGNSAGKRVRVKEDGQTRASFPTTSPLPPITPRQLEEERPYPPASPPGSSIRQTPATPFREPVQTPMT